MPFGRLVDGHRALDQSMMFTNPFKLSKGIIDGIIFLFRLKGVLLWLN
jgi:hypothetical protein